MTSDAAGSPAFPPRFKPLQRIGRGGFGEVWRADEALTGGRTRPVAIKRLLLPQNLDDRDEYRLRFRREFLILSRLDSASVIRAHDLWDDAEGLAYSMEFVSGSELRDHLVSGPLGEELRRTPDGLGEIRRLACELFGALAYLHERGVIHRDLKPGNLMVDGERRLKLIDFGLARAWGDILGEEGIAQVTTDGRVLGTPSYISPEQIQGLPLDGRCDLYAAGVILYELVTGRLPIRGNGIHDIVIGHLQREPGDPAADNPELSREFADFILALLRKRPADRPSRARQAGERLAALAPARVATAAAPARAPEPAAPEAGGEGLLVPPFVGNESALAAVRALVAGIAAGRGGALRVGGPAGSGKSRLLEELRAAAAGAAVRCLSGAATPGGPPGQLFHAVFARLAERFKARPDRITDWLGAEGPLLAHWFPALAAVPGLAPGEPPARDARPRMVAAFAGVFARLAARERCALLAEDLQWADPLSLELLAELVERQAAPGAPGPALAIVATLRPEGAAAAARLVEAGARVVELAPVGAAEAARLLGAALGLPAAAPADAAARLAAAGSGNPGAMLALADRALRAGRLRREPGGGWSAADLRDWLAAAEGAAPAPPERAPEALRLAALIDREFLFRWWAALAEGGEAEAAAAADEALRAGVLEAPRPGWLRFASEERRTALAATFSESARRAAHARILRALAGELAELAAPLRARHALASGDPAAALQHGHAWASRLIGLGQGEAAAEWLARLGDFAEAADGETRRRQLQLGARAENLRGDYAAVRALAERGATLAREAGDERQRADCLRLASMGAAQTGDAGAAAMLAESAVAVCRRGGWRREEAWGHFALAGAAQRAGDPAAAAEPLARTLALATALQDEELRGHALTLGGILAWEGGRLDEARARFLEADAAGERGGNSVIRAAALGNAAEIAFYRGDLPAAAEGLTHAERLNRSLGLRLTLADNLHNLAQLALARGDAAEAGRRLDEAEKLAERTGDPAQRALFAVSRAKWHALAGRAADARRVIDEAVAGCVAAEFRFGEAIARVVKARLALDEGRAPVAAAEAAASLAAARALGLKNTEALALSALALARRMTGEGADGADFSRAGALAAESGHLEAELVVAHRRALAQRLDDAAVGRAALQSVAARARGAGLVELAARIARDAGG